MTSHEQALGNSGKEKLIIIIDEVSEVQVGQFSTQTFRLQSYAFVIDVVLHWFSILLLKYARPSLKTTLFGWDHMLG